MTSPRSSLPPGRTLLVGFGKLGRRLAPRLIADDGQVSALRRGLGELPPGVHAIGADLTVPMSERLPVFDAMVVTLPPLAGAPSGGGAGYRTALMHLADALPH